MFPLSPEFLEPEDRIVHNGRVVEVTDVVVNAFSTSIMLDSGENINPANNGYIWALEYDEAIPTASVIEQVTSKPMAQKGRVTVQETDTSTMMMAVASVVSGLD